jgi:hypothetical protein
MIVHGDNEHEGEPRPDGQEFTRSDQLIDYLRGQFQDAYSKQWNEDLRAETAVHGSFYQTVPLPTGHELTRDSVRIVMKLPHPHDTPSSYYEVFAIYTEREDGTTLPDVSGFFASQFLVRDCTHGEPIHWLVNDDGARKLDLDIDFDKVTGLAAEEPDNPFEPYFDAVNLLEDMGRYNIVAMSD